jgi:YVTN family beta-propeller protein
LFRNSSHTEAICFSSFLTQNLAQSKRIQEYILKIRDYLISLVAIAFSACSQSPTPTNHLVLVSQAGSSTVAVVDPGTGETIKRISVGGLPHRLLVVGDKVYALLVGSQAIAEIDIKSLSVTRTMLTAPVPAKRGDGSVIQGHIDGDAFSETSCFVCHNTSVDGVKPFIVGERPVGLTLSSDTSKLIVSHLRNSRLTVVNRASGILEQSVSLTPTGDANELSDVARVNDKLVVTMRPPQPSTKSGVVRWFNENTLEMLSESLTGSDPSFILPLPQRNSALVSNFESNTVTEFKSGLELVKREVTPGPLGSKLLANGQVLTLNYYSNSVSILDLVSNQTSTYKLELNNQEFVNPTNAALSPDGQIAYIVSSGTDAHLLMFDLQLRRVVKAIAIDGLSFDAVVIYR